MLALHTVRPLAGALGLAVLAAVPAPAITEAEFMAAVAASHPALAAAEARVPAAEAELVRAGRLANPTLSWATERPDGGAHQDTASLAWELPLDGRRALQRRAAEEGLAAARGLSTYERLLLRLDAQAAYATWYAATEEVLALRELAVRMEALAERARLRAEIGEESGLAARRLALEAFQARAELARAEARAATSRERVAIWVPDLAADARPEPPAPPAAVAAAELQRPDLAALAAEVRRAEIEVQLARRVLGPPALELGWQRIEDRALRVSGPLVALSLPLPLLDRRQADRIAAAGRLRGASARLELARLEAEGEAKAAAASLARLGAEAASGERARELADRVVLAAEAAFVAGEASVTDLLDSLRAARAARQAALEMLVEALAAERRVAAATGLGADGGGR